jgi:alkanesulfonate monooxygenase SsuD/methylene tetrahydromethanopterin reductase-like flavin-dependent oxidoreductase (luciferase family)
MILPYPFGPPDHLLALAALYRAAGERAGHAERLRLGIGIHYLGTESRAQAEAAYPYYFDYLKPKKPGGPGIEIPREHYLHSIEPGQALMAGSPDHVVDKLIAAIVGCP